MDAVSTKDAHTKDYETPRPTSVDDLGGDEGRRDHDTKNPNRPQTDATSRTAARGAPELFGESRGAEGIRLEATPLVRPHHRRRAVVAGGRLITASAVKVIHVRNATA